MEICKIDDFSKGWFVGNFVPTLVYSNDFEVAIKYYKTGDKEMAHFHKIAVEYTAIAKGKVKMNGTIIEEGSIVTIAPNEITDFEVLEDTITVVVKLPSVANDKFIPQ